MKHKKRARKELSPQESQLIDQLREHPEMMIRVQSILEIVRNEDGPLKTADEVEEHLEPSGTPEENSPVRNCHRYLTNRTDCLDYPRALKLGLPIGSGMIESGHRHVLHSRLKKAGTAWRAEHPDRIANLRVLRANGKWLNLWN